MAVKLYLEKAELDKRINEIISDHSSSVKKKNKEKSRKELSRIREQSLKDLYKLMTNNFSMPVEMDKTLFDHDYILVLNDNENKIKITHDGIQFIMYISQPINTYNKNSYFRKTYNYCIDFLQENDIKFREFSL